MNPFPPVPAPPFLLNHLHGLVFIVHIIFMNFVLAAPIVILWNLLFGGDDKRQVSQWIAAVLPVTFTFTITFGVAPLLFVQVLFPERFYTANILIGNFWISIIPLLMAAFYAAYLIKYFLSKPWGLFLAGTACLVTAMLTWTIAAIMTGNYFATTMAERWTELAANTVLVFSNQTFLPRLLHYLFGAFSVTGIWMFWIGWWRKHREEDPVFVSVFRKKGLLLAAGATGAQVIVGVWFLIWLPGEAWDRLFSGSFPSLIWISGVAAGLALLGVLIVATVYPERPHWPKIGTALLAWTMVGMVSGREQLRQLAFDPSFRLSSIPSQTQTKAMLLFIVLLIGALFLITLLIWRIWRLAPKPPIHEE